MWGHRSRAVVMFAGALFASSGVIVADVLLGQVAPVHAASLAWQDINPDTDNGGRNAASGGRVNGLASASANNNLYFAASEFGGLFRTTNGGTNWTHLDGHLPTVMWDVAVDAANNNNVYATSFFDGRLTTSLAYFDIAQNNTSVTNSEFFRLQALGDFAAAAYCFWKASSRG